MGANRGGLGGPLLAFMGIWWLGLEVQFFRERHGLEPFRKPRREIVVWGWKKKIDWYERCVGMEQSSASVWKMARHPPTPFLIEK